MLKIRLSRVGKKKQPAYRVVVADARAPRDGAYVEIVGHYNPRTEPTTFEIDADRVRDWLSKGAQPTLIVEKLLARRGMLPARVWPEAKPKAEAPKAALLAAPAPTAPEAPVAVAVPEAAAEPVEAATEAATEEPAAEEAAEEAEA